MTISLKHAFTSAVADSGDATLVQPSNWNAEHAITMATGKVLGRATGGTGAVEELSVTGSGNVVLATAPTFGTSIATPSVLATANDSGALGASGTAFSDLFLASGAVIDFAAGNAVLTHSSGILTVSTGDLRVTTAGTNAASAVTVGGTQTLTNKTLTAPVLGTPSSGTLTNCTGLPSIVVADEATDTSCFLGFFTAATGELGPKTNTNMTFNSNTGVVTFASSVLTTTDINGGTVDGAVIGGASAAAGTFTAAVANSFVPNANTVPSNGMYLPAANTLGWAINSAAELQLTGTALSPAADGGSSLGTTALGWQNLFGNTGFVLNIEGGDWVATHTSGILTVGTGDLRVTTAGTNAASVVTVGGTQTLANKTLTTPVLGAATGTSVTVSGLLQAGTTLGISTDVLLNRDAANVLAQRNGTTAQVLRVYNTFTDASNYERGFVRYVSNALEIGHEAAGTGTEGRTINFITSGFTALSLSGSLANFGVNLFVQNASIMEPLNITGQTGYHEMVEMTAPSAPAADKVRIYAVDSAGKTRLMALFPSGAAQQIAIEP